MLAKFQGVWLIQAFFSRRAKTQGKKMKLKQFFLKTQAIFSKKKKNSRNRKFSKTLTAKFLKSTTIWTPNVTFSNFLLLKMNILVKNSINALSSRNSREILNNSSIFFLKTQAKFRQNSRKILKNSIDRKFQLRPLPPKRLKKSGLIVLC